MKLGVRGKLFVISLFLIVIAVLPAGIFLEHRLRNRLENEIESGLMRHARSACVFLEIADSENRIESMDPIADRLGRAANARTTIIASSGQVLGDSSLSISDTKNIENHANRPEIAEALRTGTGSSRRYSTTLGTNMLYTAHKYTNTTGVGVVRMSVKLSDVDRAVGRFRLTLLLGALVILGFATLLGGLASHFYTRNLKKLVVSASKIAEGRSKESIPVRSKDEIGGLIGSFNRMQAELSQLVSSLAHERDRFEAVLEGMDDGVLALDVERRITHINAKAIELLGLQKPPLGKTILETVRIPTLAELIDNVTPVGSKSTEFLIHANQPKRLRAMATAQRSHEGMVVVLHDVTELRRLETVRKDFVANVSHELRTPVSIIKANTETLLNGALDDPTHAKTFTEAIYRHAERLSQLISDLLDISCIDSGKLKLDLQPVALKSVLGDCLEAMQTAARQKNMSIQADIHPDQIVRADKKALHQIMFNLLDNAVKYTPAGGNIKIQAVSDNKRVRVEVQDDGPGVAPSQRNRLFERFYRVDTGRSREMGGTGLGLSIAKNLVESMGGHIGNHPADPQGSVFWFTLPV